MEGLAEGIEKGKAHGIEHGKKMMIISLIKDGVLSKEEGVKRLSISVIELDEYMSAENRNINQNYLDTIMMKNQIKTIVWQRLYRSTNCFNREIVDVKNKMILIDIKRSTLK